MNYKLIIEDNLHKIDAFFKDKSKKDIYMIYIMIFGVIGTIAYPFYDLSVNEFRAANEKVEAINTKINADNIYLNVNPPEKITMLSSEISKLQSQLLEVKNNNEYIKGKIETISSLIYDEIGWGAYLSSISKNASKHNVKILKFTNKHSKSNESFGHILDITLQFAASYPDTIKFINSLETSDLVVDIHNFSIKSQNQLITNLDISVWGITY